MKIRSVDEVMIKGKSLEDILVAHTNWLDDEEGGQRADLRYANLSYVDLRGVNLGKSDLHNSNISHSLLQEADFEGANLNYCKLTSSDAENTNFRFTELQGADLRLSSFRGADFEGAYLGCSKLQHSDFSYSDFRNADLKWADFCSTNLYKAKGDFVGIENVGSRNDTTHYFYKDNRVICGCFDDTIEQFEEKVKIVYKSDDKEYKQYMIAIRTLKELAELEKEE